MAASSSERERAGCTASVPAADGSGSSTGSGSEMAATSGATCGVSRSIGGSVGGRELFAPAPRIAPLRRTLGVTGALAGLAHGAIGAVRYAGLSLATLDAIPWLRHGALAALALVPLLLTSFAPITRALWVRAWKALHLAAYAATPLALLHALEAPGSDLRAVLALAALVGLGLAVRLVPRRASGDESDLVHTRASS